MKAAQLKGKTIRKVHQRFASTGENRSAEWIVEAIEFTDGTFARFHTVECDDKYFVAGVYPARGMAP